MRRRPLLFLSALLGAALVAPTQVPAAGATASSSVQTLQTAGQLTSVHADAARKKKKKKKKRKVVKKAPLRAPKRVTATGTSLDNAVRLSWGGVPNATRYRVQWSFAPWDLWPGATRYSGWLPASGRSITRVMSTDAAHDPTMTALPYANPVFTRVQAANRTKLGFLSELKATWPKVPQPASGDPVRFGTYNVMLAGREGWETRRAAIARNIAARGLTVVALQETLSTDGSDVADVLTDVTGHTWAVAPTYHTEGRILYDATRFELSDSGTLNEHSPYGQPIKSYRTGTEIPLPWARLSAIGSDTSFVVVSIHFAPKDVTSGPNAQSNKETGASARAVLAALDGLTDESEPAVIAGDFASGYGLWGDSNPAHPTLVRAGWWDAMASMSKTGVNYSTVNKLAAQAPAATVGGRADAIFLRGVRGTSQYQNVVNYFVPGTSKPPSDHNLVWSAFEVPPTETTDPDDGSGGS